MKVKALRYKAEANFFKEFVSIEEIGGEPMVMTSTIPKLQPKSANLVEMKELFEDNDYYEGLELDFDKLELVEFDLIESGEVGADIRNKLSPPKNLVALLEVFFETKVGYTDERKELVEIIKKEMEQTKKSIEYISNLL